MAKYRTKPVTVEAVQYFGVESFPELEIFMDDEYYRVLFQPGSEQLIILTSESDYRVEVGDWIIRNEKGEFYSCKPDIFNEIYEKVREC